ncbi:hypothetical protein ES319_D05G380000v1 [Gossypium barbadense]|uniref:Uncharacterized protein n=2 Tax=Gossypium TaxID=3633 RepID=A0A5J5RN33_GOSBA|nr:hypothetical protein ES319_D05G380000v1 [Gossypium barbadense]TYH74471.1 hypothetical protein ES332_D05G401200v1 [Gossypium tomentosum]
MGRGKFKGKPTGHRHFSTPEELRAGTSARPRTFKKGMLVWIGLYLFGGLSFGYHI